MKQGFSLVELSIVLVILGLLVGGILAGQSLIRAAELRTVSRDIGQYQTALYSFRDKYFQLPGDFSMATKFWGDQATGTGACADAAVTDGTPGTCSGNGTGKVDWAAEAMRSWQHMALAGLIEGTYSGIGLPGLGNTPPGRINNAYFSLYWGTQTGNTPGTAVDPNRFYFGRAQAADTNSAAALVPEDAWNIDTKTDDGAPGLGRMRSATGVGASGVCAPSSSAYQLDNKGIACYFSYAAD